MIEEVFITTEFIKLNQLLKLTKLISNGCEDKQFIFSHQIFVNNTKVFERGKKIYPNDLVKIQINFEQTKEFRILKKICTSQN